MKLVGRKILALCALTLAFGMAAAGSARADWDDGYHRPYPYPGAYYEHSHYRHHRRDNVVIVQEPRRVVVVQPAYMPPPPPQRVVYYNPAPVFPFGLNLAFNIR